MFDLTQMGYPREVEVDGELWMGVHFIGIAKDGSHQLIAIRPGDDGKFVVPAPCFVIQVPPGRTR